MIRTKKKSRLSRVATSREFAILVEHKYPSPSNVDCFETLHFFGGVS